VLGATEYDYRNQMVEYNDLQNGQRHTYAYDALGQWVAKVVDAGGSGRVAGFDCRPYVRKALDLRKEPR
jgi:YD repeat-containing protein